MLYAGNIGLAQEWDLILNLAKEIKDEFITIWIIGEGVKKGIFLKSQIEKHQSLQYKTLTLTKIESICQLLICLQTFILLQWTKVWRMKVFLQKYIVSWPQESYGCCVI